MLTEGDIAALFSGWPIGAMKPLGYVVSRFTIYKGDEARHFRRWIDRAPGVFHHDVLGESGSAAPNVEGDSSSLGWLKDFHSLAAMAHEARKPRFRLKPADGAIGGHQQAVFAAYSDFKALAERILAEIGLDRAA